jgi:hypothetical protein
MNDIQRNNLEESISQLKSVVYKWSLLAISPAGSLTIYVFSTDEDVLNKNITWLGSIALLCLVATSAISAIGVSRIEQVKALAPKCSNCSASLVGKIGTFALKSGKCQKCGIEL